MRLTRQAWQALETSTAKYVRTRQHPVLDSLPARLAIHSFEHLYDSGQTLEGTVRQIVEEVLELGRRPQGVIYAAPGHPLITDAISLEISRRVQDEAIPIRVIDGISFLDVVFSELRVNPLPQMSIVDALELVSAHVTSFPPDAPAVAVQIHSREIASGLKRTLLEVYPPDHPVRLLLGAGTPGVSIQEFSLSELDRANTFDSSSSLYIPPLGNGTSFEAFQEVIAHLRAPEGCPWDREQTHESLRPHLLEEAYEVLAALDSGNPDAMREEFGDLLLQIVLHAQIASEYGEFRMADVLRGVHTKIVSRHPHVFGELDLKDAQDVLNNWERLKAAERQSKGEKEKGLLDGVPTALPALLQAQTYQERAARVGFDWPDVQGVLDKLYEEWKEFNEAPTERQSEELGDLLFAAVNLARWYSIDAEDALREANARFKKRFAVIESAARSEGRRLDDLTLEEMDAHWNRAKREE
jgi:tetrapyrrole methylase family protein/MazG family protein